MDGGAVIFNVGLWHYGSSFTFLKAIFEEVRLHIRLSVPLPVHSASGLSGGSFTSHGVTCRSQLKSLLMRRLYQAGSLGRADSLCSCLQVARTLPHLLPLGAPQIHLLWKTITSDSVLKDDARCPCHEVTHVFFKLRIASR